MSAHACCIDRGYGWMIHAKNEQSTTTDFLWEHNQRVKLSDLSFLICILYLKIGNILFYSVRKKNYFVNVFLFCICTILL